MRFTAKHLFHTRLKSMKRVSVSDITSRLDVTPTQVLMMVYSGGLPNFDEHEEWNSDHIEPFIQNWARRIENRTRKSKPIQTTKELL